MQMVHDLGEEFAIMKIDMDKSGDVSYTEYFAATMDDDTLSDTLLEALSALDVNNDKKILENDLRILFNAEVPSDYENFKILDFGEYKEKFFPAGR